MGPQRMIYGDNRGITITESFIQIKKKTFALKSIKKHRVCVKKPSRIAETVSCFIGLPMAACGMFNFITPVDIPYIRLGEAYYNPNEVALWAGMVYIALGLIPLFTDRKTYALRITTGAGKQTVLTSSSRKYIMSVAEALNQAFASSPKQSGKTRTRVLVS